MRARFVVRQFATCLDANFYSPTPGLEVTRVLLAMALSTDLSLLFGDIGVAFMNTPVVEGNPVFVEPPEDLFENNDTVWCLKRATRSEAQPTLFVDLARNVFIAVRVDDLIMVGLSSQLNEVVAVMKQ